MKSFITWCCVLAFLWMPILAEEDDEVDREQQKRQTIFSTASTLPGDSLLHDDHEATSGALVAAPTATPAPIVQAPAHSYVARTILPIARPVALPLPAYPFAYPLHKPIYPFHLAPYPLAHAFAPAPVYLPQTHFPSTALKVVPAPNLAPSFAPIYPRYTVTPFGFGYHQGYHPALKFF
ncbi:uncharacterized protein LOC132264820 [Phlebotomus argentipes]|uniref:uncharacterized protein LOC132264820 n=1 Tax=Phlebotomus argentipes TaxID=94469 RepID=UPI0028934537|nr:uncharacterized protein LOC132264820 [Phlebotomus argentipes]